MLSLFVFGHGLLGHLSISSMIYVANKFSVLCVCSLLSPNLVYHWRHAGDSFWFYYAIMSYVYFSEMSTRQQRMMLKIIQINSFLFLLIRPSPVSWMTVNRIICCYLNSFPGPRCLGTWIKVHNLPGDADSVHCHLCVFCGNGSRCLKPGLLLGSLRYVTALSFQWSKIRWWNSGFVYLPLITVPYRTLPGWIAGCSVRLGSTLLPRPAALLCKSFSSTWH